jgi:hypothetical protein
VDDREQDQCEGPEGVAQLGKLRPSAKAMMALDRVVR